MEILYFNENKKSIYKKILDNFIEEKNSTILIYGKDTSCKTEICKKLFEELQFITIFYNIFNDIDILKDIYNFNNKNFNNILNNSNFFQTKALIIDNLDFISLNIKKKYLKNIIIENLKHKKIPMILVCNSLNNKLLEEIIKEKIHFNKYLIEYNHEEIINILQLKLDLELDTIKMLCIETNFNIKIILNIYNLYKNLDDDTKNIDTLKYILSIFYFKMDTPTIFDSFTSILKTTNMNEIKYYYDKDKVILPLILHENYINVIQKNKTFHMSEKINCITKISKIISFGDSIETFIYSDQNWILHNSHCFITCILTSYLLNPYITEESLKKDYLAYSTELNKTSLMNINKKNIYNIIQITNLQVNEIFYLNYLLNNLMEDSLEKIIIILYDYIHLNKLQFLKLIDMILKIDKTYDFKSISLVDKKKIFNLLVKMKD